MQGMHRTALVVCRRARQPPHTLEHRPSSVLKHPPKKI